MGTEYIRISELERLVRDPVPKKWQMIYRVLFFSALRANELLTARVRQLVKTEDGYFLLLEKQKNGTKNELTPMRKEDFRDLVWYVRNRRYQQDDYIFQGQRGKHTVQYLDRQIKKHGLLVGIRPFLASHAFRRGRVVHLANQGVPYAEISTITRHKSVVMLMKHYDKDVKRRSYELLQRYGSYQ